GINWAPEHFFISTDKCGAFGFYQDWRLGSDIQHAIGLIGNVRPDDNRLIRPGKGKGSNVHCDLFTTDPRFEALICQCKDDAGETGWYSPIVIGRNCSHWMVDIFSCAEWRMWLEKWHREQQKPKGGKTYRLDPFSQWLLNIFG